MKTRDKDPGQNQFFRSVRGFRKIALFSAVFFLCGCGAAGTGGQTAASDPQEITISEPAQTEKKDPQYVYYVKDGSLMCADVNAAICPPENPSVLLKDAAVSAGLKDTYHMLQAQDGSFSAFHFGAGADLSDRNGRIAAVSLEDKTAEIISSKAVQMQIHGNDLLILEPDDGDVLSSAAKTDIYTYRPGEGKKRIIKNIYDLCPSVEDMPLYFSRINGDRSGLDLYRYLDGQETLVLSGYDFAGLSPAGHILYGVRPAGDDLFFYEIKGVGQDGSVTDLLTETDHAVSYYLEPELDSLYFSRAGDPDTTNLYYRKNGKDSLLAGENPVIWDVLRTADRTDESAMVLFYDGPDSRRGFYAAVDGTVSKFIMADAGDGWDSGCVSSAKTGDHCVYLVLSKKDGSPEPCASRIYKYSQKEGRLGPVPECVAEGREFHLEKADGGIFYTDASGTLYYNGTQLMDRYVSGSLLTAGNSAAVYFALRKGEENKTDLMMLEDSGSFDVLMKNVVQYEAYEDGLLLLSDCRDTDPHLGTFSFYDGGQIKKIDENVAVFYKSGTNPFVDAVPEEWAENR